MCFLVMVHFQMRLVYYLPNIVKKINIATPIIALFEVIMTPCDVTIPWVQFGGGHVPLLFQMGEI